MSIRVQVPGHGIVEFPDGTTEDQMRQALSTLKAPTETPAAAAPAPPSKITHPLATFAELVGDIGVGAAKKLIERGLQGGAYLRQIPGVQALDDLLGNPGIDVNTTRTTPAQRVGGVVEQVAETIAPTKALTALGAKAAGTLGPTIAGAIGSRAAQLLPQAAVEAVGGAGLAAAQGGDPRLGAVGGAVAPLIGAGVQAVAPALKASAEAGVMRALGPTKEHFKALGEKLVPEMLKRGIRGSREGLAQQAAVAVEAAGQQIDAALQAFGSRQASVAPVVDALERAKDTFRSTNAAGHTVVFEPRAIKQLDGLQQVMTDLGPDARVDQLVAVRRTWDKVVADAGGFSHRAPGGIGRPLKDISEATHKREATTAIRQLLDTAVPELSALNKEYSFWKNLDDVVSQTLQRTQPHGASLTGTMKEAAGQMVGSAATGGNLGAAFALGKVAKMANTVFTSPRWQLASAQAKDALADAIVSGNVSKITTALARVGAVQGSKVPAAVGGY